MVDMKAIERTAFYFVRKYWRGYKRYYVANSISFKDLCQEIYIIIYSYKAKNEIEYKVINPRKLNVLITKAVVGRLKRLRNESVSYKSLFVRLNPSQEFNDEELKDYYSVEAVTHPYQDPDKFILTPSFFGYVRKILPKKQYAVVSRRFLKDMTFIEIADDVGCSASTVHKHYKNAMVNLKKAFSRNVT